MESIYMDNNATTPLNSAAFADLMKWSQCANPSSTKHGFGRKAKAALEDARRKIARKLNVPPGELYFTSGATEANNLAIQGIVKAYDETHGGGGDGGGHIVCSAIEHKACLDVCKELERQGHAVTYVNPGPHRSSGIVTARGVRSALRDNTCLIVVMHANNELGTIQDVEGIGVVAARRGIPFHCDCAQSAGRIPGGITPRQWGATSVAISAHKFGGPKGVGALWLSRRCNCMPLAQGGKQEEGLRPGTENVGGVVSMATALESALVDRESRNARLRKLCFDVIVGGLARKNVGFQVLGNMQQRLANTLLLSFSRSPFRPNKAVCNSKIVQYLDEGHGAPSIAISIGSACNTKDHAASHVLDAIGAAKDVRQGAVRISIGDQNTLGQCKVLVAQIERALKDQGIIQ